MVKQPTIPKRCLASKLRSIASARRFPVALKESANLEILTLEMRQELLGIDLLTPYQFWQKCSRVFKVDEILELLADDLASRLGLSKLRAYVVDQRRNCLMGIATQGLCSEAANLFRLAQIEHRLDESRKDLCESAGWWCILNEQSLLVSIENGRERGGDLELEPYGNGLKLAKIPELCPELSDFRDPLYLDVPFNNQRGKISVGFTGKVVPSRLPLIAKLFEGYARIAGDRISALYTEAVVDKVFAVKDSFREVRDLVGLAAKCKSREFLAQLRFEHAKFFVVSKDSVGETCVHQYLKGQFLEHECEFVNRLIESKLPVHAFVSEDGKTVEYTHVANQKMSLDQDRIKALANQELFGMPIVLHGQTVAVVVFYRTASGDMRGVSSFQGLVNQWVVEECFLPVLANRIERDRAIPVDYLSGQSVFEKSEKQVRPSINSLTRNDFGSLSEFLRKLKDGISDFHVSEEKLCFLNLLVGDGQFRDFRLFGDCESDVGSMKRRRLKGSLTKLILDSDGPVFVHDLRLAREKGFYLDTIPNAVSAIGAKISVETDEAGAGKLFGAIVVFSKRKDLHPWVFEGPIQQLANGIAENMARRVIHSKLLRGLGHEVRKAYRIVENRIRKVKSLVHDKTAIGLLDEVLAIEQCEGDWLNACAMVADPTTSLESIGRPVSVYEAVQSAVNANKSCDFVNQVPRDLEIVGFRELLSTAMAKVFMHGQTILGWDGPVEISANVETLNCESTLNLSLSWTGEATPEVREVLSRTISQDLSSILVNRLDRSEFIAQNGIRMAQSMMNNPHLCDNREPVFNLLTANEGKMELQLEIPFSSGSALAS